MDMWPAFINAVGETLPDAELVFDRFHVSKPMGDAVNMVRRGEHKELIKTGDTRLVGSRFDWLRSEETIRPDKREDFDALKASELKTARAWAIKELLKAFWECPSEGFAETHFHRWYHWAIRSHLAPVKKVARMLKKHLAGLLSYFRQLDYQRRHRGAQQQDPGDQGSCQGISKLRSLSDRDSVSLRPPGHATKNDRLKPVKNQFFLGRFAKDVLPLFKART